MTNVYRTSLPIARLRDMGCRVSTCYGHEVRRGYWIYAITLPKGVGPTEFTDIEEDAAAKVIVKISNTNPEHTVLFAHSTHALDWRKGDAVLAERLDSAASYLAERLRVVSNPRTKIRRK
jgi:hypothetical protein